MRLFDFMTKKPAERAKDREMKSVSKLDFCCNTKRNAERWLNEHIQRGRNGIHYVVADLTPALAQVLLARNDANRILQEETVRKYSRDHEQGLFDGLNGESIKMSKCGLMNDGQHRCTMVERTNIPLRTTFVFGLERESRKTLDQGAARTAGHYMSMDGVKNANNMAAMAKIVLQVEKYGKIRTGADAPTKSEVMSFADPRMDELQESFAFIHRKGAANVASLSLLGACHYLTAQLDESDADRYMKSIIDGTEMHQNDPAYAVRSKLMTRALRLNVNEKLNVIFSGWNKFRRGQKVRQLGHGIKKGEALPELK